ncbi:tetratricopeptide repeat-containing sulfotransferase family protein [Dyella sp.]|uniref:tetratricopeptide repeat-containing sulfotransferase family protein n=1 Tax=Dyella sp. TaxID=1869338 RepID=UPI002D78CD0C|nr:sulfotransferase [Dyella sp.]HET6431235.1 sulfotransferase [Dyella sp.]
MSGTAVAGPVAEQALVRAAELLQTDPAQAEQVLHELLATGHPEARRLQAAARAARGDDAGALMLLQSLAMSHPQWGALHCELGLTLGRLQRHGEAVAAFRRALALAPALPQAWRLLADACLAAGDADGADAAFVGHVAHAAADPALLAAGNALAAGRLPEAERLLRARLREAPTDVAAIRMFAELAMRLGRNDDALNLLARCLDLAPGFHAARQNYALALHRANQPALALAQIDLLLAAEPAHPAHRNLKAVVLCRVGDYEPAIALYADLLAEYPDNAQVWMSYGHALKTAGHATRAIEAYRHAVAQVPSFGEVWWSLANLKTFRFDDDDLASMRAQLARDDLSDDDRLHLDFAIGKALEDRAEYAGSFAHYASANARRRAQLRYDPDETHARVEHIRRQYTARFFAERAGSGSTARDPIFIVGLPRSGSTLIEQILSSHSQVEGTMELPEITSITKLLREQADGEAAMPYHDTLARLDAGALRDLGERYLAHTRIQRKTSAPLFIDKMPNNFMHIGLIHLMLPNAIIIDARRHPMACCFSGFKQHFARGQSFSYRLEDLGRYYRDYVALMAHYDDVLPGRVYRVTYERMVDDTEGEVRRLLEHCRLPFESACLRFFENARPVRTASSEQVRQPIFRDGVDQWRHYAPWLEPLEQSLGEVLRAYPAVPQDGEDR